MLYRRKLRRVRFILLCCLSVPIDQLPWVVQCNTSLSSKSRISASASGKRGRCALFCKRIDGRFFCLALLVQLVDQLQHARCAAASTFLSTSRSMSSPAPPILSLARLLDGIDLRSIGQLRRRFSAVTRNAAKSLRNFVLILKKIERVFLL